MILKTATEIHILQITTGKHLKTQVRFELDSKKNKSGEFEK